MLKSLLPALLLTIYLYLTVPGETVIKPACLTAETEEAIVYLVRDAVEDTAWLRASSQGELELLLKRYYTGEILHRICDNAWAFIRVPNSWDYIVKAGQIKVYYFSGDTAAVSAEIIETDEITGISYHTHLEYLLLRTDSGWKISGRKVLSG